MEAVKGGLMGVNQAARNFEVHRTTFRNRLTGQVEHGANMAQINPLSLLKKNMSLLTFSRHQELDMAKLKKKYFRNHFII